MGQYYKIVNIDKKEYISPHKFGDGAKLLEFGSSGEGTMNGLAILLADGNGRGGGDLDSRNPIVGSWTGDRIVIAGDYADPNETQYSKEDAAKYLARFDVGENKESLRVSEPNLYYIATELYRDVSRQVITALSDDSYLKRVLSSRNALDRPGEKIV